MARAHTSAEKSGRKIFENTPEEGRDEHIKFLHGIGDEVYEKNSGKNDQKRINSPSQAINNGSNMLIIGRSITQSSDPISSIKSISLSKPNQKTSIIESYLIDENRFTLKKINSRNLIMEDLETIQ